MNDACRGRGVAAGATFDQAFVNATGTTVGGAVDGAEVQL